MTFRKDVEQFLQDFKCKLDFWVLGKMIREKKGLYKDPVRPSFLSDDLCFVSLSGISHELSF